MFAAVLKEFTAGQCPESDKSNPLPQPFMQTVGSVPVFLWRMVVNISLNKSLEDCSLSDVHDCYPHT
jgi:hypothetical protein